jgi:hypothetical protein
MPDEVIKLLDKIAEKDGITRESVLFEDSRTPMDEALALMTDDNSDEEDKHEKGPTFKEIPADKRAEGLSDADIEVVEEGDDAIDADPEMPVESDLEANEAREGGKVPEPQDNWVRRSVRLAREIGLIIETGSGKMRSTACQLSKGPTLVESLSKKLSDQDCDSARRAIRQELECRSHASGTTVNMHSRCP